MKRRWKNLFVKTAIASVLASGGAAHAARLPRIELLRAASVSGTRVLPSELLPARPLESLRDRTADISLGAAPQAGNARRLERDAVERDASASPEELLEVSVPARRVVSRDERAITLAEVFTAIRAALNEHDFTSEGGLRPEDILLEAQILVAPGDAGLRVMRMDLDRGLRRARFLLWTSLDPQVLPFYATARLESGLAPALIPLATQIIQRGRGAAILAAVPAKERPAKREILVAQGERATLTLRSPAVRIFVDVVCLEKGALGQRVHVRLLDSGKVFDAQVDGRSQLEAAF